MKENNIVDLSEARWKKEHERKDEKVDAMRKRFEHAFPDKPTPIKDYMKKKRRKKKS